METTMIAVINPRITTLKQASQMATAAHLHLITKDGKTVLSPTIPRGWAKIGGGTPAQVQS